MTITFLIGNGFDLGLGLETRFKDYFKYFCADNHKNQTNSPNLADSISKQTELWSDFESALGEFTEKFTLATKEKFFEQLENFEKGFLDYLKTQENRIIYNEDLVKQTLTSALMIFQRNDLFSTAETEQIQNVFLNHAAQEYKYNFIDFNYTETLERCLNWFPDHIIGTHKYRDNVSNCKINIIIHVHGTEDALPIIGVDNVNQIKNKTLANDPNFVDRFVKSRIDNRLGTKFAENSRNIIKQSDIICIYGMSIGATDATWWKELVTWLRNDKSHLLLFFKYDENFDNTTIPSRVINEKDKAIKSILRYGELNQGIFNEISKRIYVTFQSDIFSMNLTASQS